MDEDEMRHWTNTPSSRKLTCMSTLVTPVAQLSPLVEASEPPSIATPTGRTLHGA
jgi:hypothetical protein